MIDQAAVSTSLTIGVVILLTDEVADLVRALDADGSDLGDNITQTIARP